jgi:phage-related protein
MFLADPAVHTTGVNWVSVITITCTIAVVVGGLFAYVARHVTNSVTRTITAAINNFHLSVVSVLTTRLTVVETKQDDMNQKLEDLKNTKGRDKENDQPNHA